ncbi:GNAT family N-acetyltransferase [Verminephrobacter aporrectodeae subsp. tuberculatae]|uniref:GNAT family N-acetyltransferase n=1 Tax=Verminephrobacter aporrectodeae TaxID=1110389 RepID=UPI00224356A9|nr:GNAT family N-acetyltransferase [Verminephrobacter aporrectodeae]MCW8198256.1 GNAT family N-acetyltransferase [Verminephrobacter aporrectodeae subsp. tuberculatae]MCW8208183.1 GNAT family N-acetyltransferase [Verminephrobacter aporrectodeae subsp. tuberculatae]
MSVTLREATQADLEAVLALYAEIESDPQDLLSPQQAQAIWAQFARYPSYRLWVACDATAAVVGSYALLIMHNLAHRGAPSAIVEDVVVAAHRQGQGIGRRMMAHAMECAREAGCYKLALSSNARRTGAHAFYESLGLVRHGVSFVMDIPR